MTLKLYDFPGSPNCKRVKVVLEEKKLPYEKIFVDLPKKEQKRPDFLKLNPYGKVPVIVDGDRVLYESCMINEYLEETYPEPPLMPGDTHKRGRIRILIDYGINHFAEPYQKVRMELAKDSKDQSQPVIDQGNKELKELIQPFEAEIGDQEYLAGHFSLLDAALIPRFLRFEEWALIPDPSFPNLGKWLKRMKKRPSVRTILGPAAMEKKL